MQSTTTLRTQLNEGDRRCYELLAQCQTAGVTLSQEAREYIDQWQGPGGVREQIEGDLTRAELYEKTLSEKMDAKLYARRAESRGEDYYEAGSPNAARNFHGDEVRVLNRHSKLQPTPVSNALGQIALGIALGSNQHTHPQVRNALSTTVNPSGGFLVPDPFANEWIDFARANAVVMQAGARMVTMDGNTLTIPRLDSDPSYVASAELTTITDSDPQFAAITLTANTIKCSVLASRELLEDSPLAQEIIGQSILRGLTAKVDSIGLNGLSGFGFAGLVSHSSISETGSVGAIAWEDIILAVAAVRANNYEPSAIVCSPTIMSDLYSIASGDGTNSQKGWLAAPVHIAGIPVLASSAMPDSTIIVGDFKELLFAVRQEPLMEVSQDAGDAFTKHGVRIKCTWRGDMAVARPTAFYRLAGITT